MARRSKAQDKALGGLLLIAVMIGVPIVLVQKIGETIGWPMLIGVSLAVVVLYVMHMLVSERAKERAQVAANESRRQHLLAKYGDELVVMRIMNGEIWQGQSQEQLRDSLGAPVDTDERVTKKSRRVWKYHQTGANRFALRVTLENGVVVGWDEKL